MYDRREFLKLGTATAALSLTPGLAGASAPSPASTPVADWLRTLATSLPDEHDYAPRIEGKLPAGLHGTLYRNGPGIFERGGVRKRSLLDGDGMIQAYDFADGAVRYRNRFVRTEKFVAEQRAGAFRHSTWSLPAPGRWLSRLGGADVRSQAGVTVVHKDGRLLAFDEVGLPYELDPRTLETAGEFPVLGDGDALDYKAHTKTDGRTGDWVLFSTEFGRRMTIHVVVRSASGHVRSRQSHEIPDPVYLHDFFLTERHIIFLLHPMAFSPFPFILGFGAFMDALSWEPAAGSRVMVLDRNGTAAPVLIEAPPSFMWHTLNAYDHKDEIVAEFVGYDHPDHFVGPDPAFRAIMEGRSGEGKYPGRLRRLVIDPARRKARQEIVSDRHYEFPMINPRDVGHRHRTAYLAAGSGEGWYHDGVAAIDTRSGRERRFHFGPKHYVGEPVVTGGPNDDGFLLAQVHSGETGRAFLAVFDTADIGAGPVATLRLRHHLPVSFHGWWQPA